MYVVFRFDDGNIVCHPISYWLIFKEKEEADIYLIDDDPLELRDGQWRYAGDSVEIIEIVPDIRRFMSMSPVQFEEGHGEKEQSVA